MFCSVSSVARAEKDNVCFIARIHVKVLKKLVTLGNNTIFAIYNYKL